MAEDIKKEKNCCFCLTNGELDFSLDVSGMNFSRKNVDTLKEKFKTAHAEMKKIEAGEIKNLDENRKVTHFTDRAAYPYEELFSEVEKFAQEVRDGNINGSTGKKFQRAIINGIGGSALGPQLLQFSINGPYWNELSETQRKGNPKIYFVDNTDPAGIKDILDVVPLEETLVINISKSGGTQETQNNIIALSQAYKDGGLEYNKHFCAVTMENSNLDREAKASNWMRVFHMAESIGGRTSETSIVGHLPAALAGIDFDAFLKGACQMDVWTRSADYMKNPAYLLAAMWYLAGNGKGDKNMVIVPYSDRLLLLSRYLQQLVMESLGKEKDRDGNSVYQGLSVFGNKGGTDAHALIQQLNDGRNDFFITFIEVLKDAANVPISGKVTMGDYLHAFKTGLSNALESRNRQVIQIQIKEISPFSLGMVIALYERAVAVYAELININAFHQPGVQAYKLASKGIIKLVNELFSLIHDLAPWEGTVKEFCKKANLESQEFEVAGIFAKFSENKDDRSFENFKVSRKWDEENGWIYTLSN